MRVLILTLAIVGGFFVVPATTDLGAPISAVAVLDAQNQPPQPPAPQINVEINRGGGRAWYLNPVWMAIGGVAFVVLILLIVMAARGGGGGTTVVRG